MAGLERFYKLLLILASGYAVLAVYTCLSGHLQKRYIHDLPYWQWAVMQQAPAMYNLENLVEVNFRDQVMNTRFYNHHPMRVFYENKYNFDHLDAIEVKVSAIKCTDTLSTSYDYYLVEGKGISLKRID